LPPLPKDSHWFHFNLSQFNTTLIKNISPVLTFKTLLNLNFRRVNPQNLSLGILENRNKKFDSNSIAFNLSQIRKPCSKTIWREKLIFWLLEYLASGFFFQCTNSCFS
jgi:hypothetical protein